MHHFEVFAFDCPVTLKLRLGVIRNDTDRWFIPINVQY